MPRRAAFRPLARGHCHLEGGCVVTTISCRAAASTGGFCANSCRHQVSRAVLVSCPAISSVSNWSRVASGSMVLKDVPPNVTVAGVPARVVGVAGFVFTVIAALFREPLRDRDAAAPSARSTEARGRSGLLDVVTKPSVVMFFLFYIFIAMATAGITSFGVVAMVDLYGVSVVSGLSCS